MARALEAVLGSMPVFTFVLEGEIWEMGEELCILELASGKGVLG